MKHFCREAARYLAVAGFAVAGALAAAPHALAQDAWPTKPINIVVPTDPGGSLDRMARIVAPYLTEELGQPVNIVNKPGGNSILGHQYTLQQANDGYTLIASPGAPQLVMQIDLGMTSFDVDDFAFLNAQWIDYAGVYVPTDRPWTTWSEVVEAIKADPGRLVFITAPNNERHVIMLQLLKLAGLGPESVRIVTYGTGNDVRTAAINGQTDVAFTTVEGASTISDQVRPIMLITPERMPGYEEVETIVEAVGADNVDQVPVVSATIRTLATSAAFKEEHPERWNKLLEAYKTVLAREDVQKLLIDQDIGAEWTGPELATEMIKDYGDQMRPFLDIIAK